MFKLHLECSSNAVVTVRALLTITLCLLVGDAQSQSATACQRAGAWVDPSDGEQLAHADVLDRAATQAVVLLGETHDDMEHHRWQLSTLAGLRAHRPDLVVGFEAFPRRNQPVLDRWSKGELQTASFLDAAQWRRVWGYDAALYLPLFDFVRLHRLPMLALNVERTLVSAVGQKGWKGVAPALKEGLGDPAPASADYRQALAEVYHQHQQQHQTGRPAHGQHQAKEPSARESKTALDAVAEDPAFERFVEAQLTWDLAMAEALASAHRREGGPTVVGIVGSGHVRGGHGIPHQLAALGIDDVMVLLPVRPGVACEQAESDLADAVFLLEDRTVPAAPGPRLGVIVETVDERVRIRRVVEGSVASRAGLADEDFVLQAAGVVLREHTELITVIGRQAPGTWLPLVVERGGMRMDVIAKFPIRFE